MKFPGRMCKWKKEGRSPVERKEPAQTEGEVTGRCWESTQSQTPTERCSKKEGSSGVWCQWVRGGHLEALILW